MEARGDETAPYVDKKENWVIHTPDFFIEYLTQNVIFHVKSHLTKHEFWGLLVLKSQNSM